MKPMREVVVREDGTITPVAATGADALLGGRAGRYRVVEGPPGLLLLERLDLGSGPRRRVLAMGEIMTKTGVLELISMIANNGWRGELTVVDSTCVRRLTIDQGALKGAFSEKPTERLGEVMVALGVLTPGELARCVLHASPERRIGQIAIEEGFIDQKGLFAMLQAQAERIFQAALLVTQGHYSFTLVAEDAEAPAMTLHLPVQALLLESVQKIDEMALFRERISSGDLRPRPSASGARVSIRDTLRPVLGLVDGHRSIHEIGRELRLDEFDVTKKVMQLLQIGCIDLAEQQELDLASVDRIVKPLNELMQEILDTVERHKGQKGAREMLWTLQAWVGDSQIGTYFGPNMRLSGDISAEATWRHLRTQPLERPLESLHGAAHELVSFAMFSASPGLPREAERALSKWVNQRLARIRL